MKKEKNKKISTSYKKIYPSLIFIASLFMVVGYAAVNSISVEIKGSVIADVNPGVFIASVIYGSDNNAIIENCKLNSFLQTTLSSKIELSNEDNTSYYSYDVNIYNNSDDRYIYRGTIYDNEFYVDDTGKYNSNIIYEVIGIENNYILSPSEDIDLELKFKYNGSTITQNILNSYLYFDFRKVYDITYINIDGNKYVDYAIENEDLVINMSNEAFDSFIIKINGSEINNYTYENKILTIPNVNGDVEITGQLLNPTTPDRYFNFDASTGIITGFNDNNYEGELIIPSTINGTKVVAIGNNAFNHLTKVTKAVIPEGVTAIGDNAFSYCSSMTTVVIPYGVTTIGESAFRDCYMVGEYNLPNTVTSIADNAFRENRTITSFVVPNSVITIGTWAFAGCSSLETVTIGNGVTSIGNSTFSYDPSLKTVYIVSGSKLVVPSNRWGASGSVSIIKQ